VRRDREHAVELEELGVLDQVDQRGHVQVLVEPRRHQRVGQQPRRVDEQGERERGAEPLVPGPAGHEEQAREGCDQDDEADVPEDDGGPLVTGPAAAVAHDLDEQADE
jgi:hypothetical protein